MPRSRGKISSPEFIMKYIYDQGGHSALETMPIRRDVRGWQKLRKLKSRVKSQKAKYSYAWQFPKWYKEYISIYEPDVQLPECPRDELARLHGRDEDIESDSGPPAKTGRADDGSVVRAVPSRPPRSHIDTLFRYISQSGGHAAIETLPVSFECGSPANCELLYNLQRSLRDQRLTENPVLQYPVWYRRYISEYEPNVELPPQRQSLSAITDGLTRHILEHGGHSAIETIPVQGWPPLANLQELIRNQRSGTVLQYPKWYKELIRTYLPDVDLQGRRKLISFQLIDYIMKSGGHAALESMLYKRGVKDWEELKRLKKNIKARRKVGKSVSDFPYPMWYRQYVSLMEPNVQLPGFPAEKGAGRRHSEHNLIETEQRNPDEHIINYVKQNGGHAAIETMPLDPSVENWVKLFNLQRYLTNPANRGSALDYPRWYKKYLAVHEPGVILISPEGPSQVNQPEDQKDLTTPEGSQHSESPVESPDPDGGPVVPDVSCDVSPSDTE